MAATPSIEHWFYGKHRIGRVRYEMEAENRSLALRRIAPITIRPEELVQAIDENGVSSFGAVQFVTRLLARAEEEALRKTFGLENPNDRP